MASTAGDAAQMDMQLSKLEFEIKLQKLTNELQELKKRVPSTGKSNDSEIHQLLLERAVSQALGKRQDLFDMPAFPIVEIIDQQNNRVKQYQTLEFMVIRVKNSCCTVWPYSSFYTSFIGHWSQI